MPNWKPQDITTFQKLYLKHYGKKIDKEDADIKITALVELLSLAIEVEQSKISRDSKENNPNGNLSELN